MKIDELIIDGSISGLQALARLEETGRRILFIAPGGKLRAVITDGDVRRFILNGGDLSCPVSEFANSTTKSLPVEKRSEAAAFLQQHVIAAVPLLGKDGQIVDVVFLNEQETVDKTALLNTPVVIMAGGLGTRLYPYTKILPKPLIPIGEVPIIERVIDGFTQFGCDSFTMIVNYKKNMIKSYFADIEPKEYSVKYADEDKPLGTGGGLCLLKGEINETFFLTNCDSIIQADYSDLLRFHKKNKNAITMVCAMKQFTIPYGVAKLDADGSLLGISEKPSMNYLTNTGMYVVEPSVLNSIEDQVYQGFPDIIESCRGAGGKVGVYPIGEGSWMDMGQLEELDEMRRKFEES